MTAIEDVTIRPMQPKPSLFPEPVPPPPPNEPPAPRTFIPPAPERAAGRPPRMPRIDELPLPGQNELRAKRGEPVEANIRRSAGRPAAAARGGRPRPPRQRRAGVSAGQCAAGPARRRGPRIVPRCRRRRRRVRPHPVRRSHAVRSRSPNTPSGRRTTGSTRSAARHLCIIAGDDDQLDIPAFLRRQAN